MGRHARLPLPKHWPQHVREATVHVVSLAKTVLTIAFAQHEGDPSGMATAMARLESIAARRAEHVALLRARLARVESRRRPHYTPEERFAILNLQGANGWTIAETAAAFLVSPACIMNWRRDLKAKGKGALVKPRVAANKYPEFVNVLVRQLKSCFPLMGRHAIANLLGSIGLHLSASHVRNVLRRPVLGPEPEPDVGDEVEVPAAPAGPYDTHHGVRADYPHHVHHCDITLVPITKLWVSYLPWSLPTVWPFAWQVAAVIDQFSRKVLAIQAFRQQPSTEQITRLLERAAREAGTLPRYVITDAGCQFRERFKAWCRKRGVLHRRGAVGKHGSVAIIERFWRTMKYELCSRVLLCFSDVATNRILQRYVHWYNDFRPHQGIDGLTPSQMLLPRPLPAAVRYEPRPVMAQARASPEQRPVTDLRLVVRYHDGQEHLPVVSLKVAA